MNAECATHPAIGRRQARPRAPRPFRAAGLGLVMLAALSSCQEDPVATAVVATFDRLTTALQQRDGQALWELTTRAVRTFCDDLNGELREAYRLVDTYFPEWQRPVLRAALAHQRLSGAADGRDLFLRLLNFDAVRQGAEVAAGLRHDGPNIQGERATIRTAAGETLTFVVEDGEWRTDAFDFVRSYAIVQTLRDNMKTLRGNVQRLREIYRTSKEPKTPEGAFNQLRDALRDANGQVALALLPPPARESVRHFRESLHGALDRSGHVPDDLRARLATAGLAELDLKAAAGSDAEFVTALIKLTFLPDVLGIAPDSGVQNVRLHSRDDATVITLEATEVAFARGPDQLFHIAEATPILQAAFAVILGAPGADGDERSQPLQ